MICYTNLRMLHIFKENMYYLRHFMSFIILKKSIQLRYLMHNDADDVKNLKIKHLNMKLMF